MTADQAIAFLLEFYGDDRMGRMTAKGRAYLREVLVNMGPDDLRAVVAKQAAERFTRFPTIHQLRALYREERAARDEVVKRATVRLPVTISPEADADAAHARNAFHLIRLLMAHDPRVMGARRVEAFRKMAAAWPGVGWEQAVEETERQLAAKK